VLPGKKYTADDVVHILRKRAWMIAIPLAVGLAAGAVVFKRLPSRYQSETLIMVIPQRIPDSYVKPTVVGSVEDRLPTISDQILSRSRLERIINDFELYKEQRATGLMEDVVQRMRGDIEVKLVGKESFRVSYINRDPRTAQKVTERLAGLYIEENLRDRENISEDTSQFLESQLQDAKQRLLAHEQKLEEYQRRYAGQLPSQLPGNVQAIQNAQMQLQSVSESLNRARERRLLVERQLADAQSIPPSPSAAVNPNSPDTNVGATAAEQLESAKARLEGLKLRYKPDHPDVRAMERVIAELETKAADEQRRQPTAQVKAVSPAEAAVQKRIRDYQADLEIIDRQIAAAATEESRLKTTIADYQAKVDAVPTRESELVELTRDYKTLQETYDSLLKKQQDSKLASNLERRQIGEHFKILDPASLPQKQYNQKVKILAFVGGSFGGLFLGLAMVGFLEYRDSTFKSEVDIIRVLSLPVLALVPIMESEADHLADTRRNRRRIVTIVLTLLVIVGSAAAFALRWLH
jgi:polysaccharide chain length determinant protein (PEP-CTERM system associated)